MKTISRLATEARCHPYLARGAAIFFGIPLIASDRGESVSQEDAEFLSQFLAHHKRRPDFYSLGRRHKKTGRAPVADERVGVRLIGHRAEVSSSRGPIPPRRGR